MKTVDKILGDLLICSAIYKGRKMARNIMVESKGSRQNLVMKICLIVYPIRGCRSPSIRILMSAPRSWSSPKGRRMSIIRDNRRAREVKLRCQLQQWSPKMKSLGSPDHFNF